MDMSTLGAAIAICKASGGGGAVIDDTTVGTNKVWSSKKTDDEKAGAIVTSVENVYVANVKDGIAHSVESLVLKINPVQSGSGNPSPSNPRSISAQSSVVLKQIGANLLTNKFAAGTSGTVTFTTESGSVKTSGTASATTTWKSNVINVTADTEYKLSGCPSGGGNSTYRLDVRDESGDIIEGLNYDAGSGATFTIPSGTSQIKIGIRIADGVDTNGLVFIPVLVKSTDVPAEHTATIPTPPGSIYGGEIDWVRQKLTVTFAIIDLGDCKWYYDTTSGTQPFMKSTNIMDLVVKPATSSIKSDCVCSALPTEKAYLIANGTTTGIGIHDNGAIRAVYPDMSTDPTTFKSDVTGWKLCYPLATPVEYDLSSLDEIALAMGENNLWVENGQIKLLEYKADTKKYIDGAYDVQINGTSILVNGVANVPIASNSGFGVTTTSTSNGLNIGLNGAIRIYPALDTDIKDGTQEYRPIVAKNQHTSVFYGLAKASGDATQASSANAVGVYTESAKSSIAQMLDAPETVSGTTPSITAKAGVRYVCGECATLSVVAPASGCVDVTFTSGSTATVLTVTSAKANTTIKWANGFNPSSLYANTIYEINILDGEFGVVASWT